MLFLWVCVVMFVMARYPETPIGRMLKSVLVDPPARKLALLTPTGAWFLVLTLALSVAAIIVGRAEGAMVTAQFEPETVSWFFAFDIGTYVDVMVIASLAAASGGLRVVYERARSVMIWICCLALRCIRSLGYRMAGRRHSPRRGLKLKKPPNAVSDMGRVIIWDHQRGDPRDSRGASFWRTLTGAQSSDTDAIVP